MLSTALMLRELRAEARNPLNYRLRVLAGLAGTLLIGFAMAERPATASGLEFFAILHRFAVAVILLAAPLLTADSLSRERRDGTLPLLFLTPLTGVKIIVTKYATQLLRALGLWLALLPICVVPLLAGGVSPVQGAIAIAFQLIFLLLGLAAGMLCSAFGTRFLPVAFCSVAVTVVFVFTELLLAVSLFAILIGSGRSGPLFGPMVQFVLEPVQWTGLPVGAASWWIAWLLSYLILAAIAFPALILLGRRLAREQTGGSETARRRWLSEALLKPRFWKREYARAMSRRMAVNPLVWLEYRHAWSRAGRWALVGGLIVWQSWQIGRDGTWSLWPGQVTLLWLLMLLMCFTAANSFQNERETGAFELLLVAPFRETELYWGRLRAVWSYYRPVTIGVAAWLFSIAILIPFLFRARGGDELTGFRMLSLFLSFGTIPAAGLYFALRFKSFPAVLILTTLIALVLPAHFFDILAALHQFLPAPLAFDLEYFVLRNIPLALLAIGLIHLVLFWIFSGKAIRRLKSRTFAA